MPPPIPTKALFATMRLEVVDSLWPTKGGDITVEEFTLPQHAQEILKAILLDCLAPERRGAMRSDDANAQLERFQQATRMVKPVGRLVRGGNGVFGLCVAQQRHVALGEEFIEWHASVVGRVDLLGGRRPFKEHHRRRIGVLGVQLETMLSFLNRITPVRMHGRTEECLWMALGKAPDELVRGVKMRCLHAHSTLILAVDAVQGEQHNPVEIGRLVHFLEDDGLDTIVIDVGQVGM